MNKSEKDFLFHAMKHIPVDGVVVEIGSWVGGSSVQLAEGILKFKKNAELFCIDPWDNFCEELETARNGRNVYELFREHMRSYKHNQIKDRAENVVERFKDESIDFLFIDGDHSYEAVKRDIAMWLPKVKTGGIICGHDYGKKEYGVTEAVHETFGDAFQKSARSIWSVKK